MSTGERREATAARFGTFGGVFTPCVLTILGVIMFLRFGFVVGQAGVLCAVAIVAASKVITGLTSLSLSAIATNTRVKGGGAYYLISRSLGGEFGGAIGLVFNLATFYEAITKNPSYRPRFRYCHWTTSLAGAAGCLAVMFLIDWLWAAVAIVAIGLLHWYIGRKEVEARWGNLRSGLLFERARRNLLRLKDEHYHPKNWRPIVLALSGAGWDRPHLAVYGHWFTTGHGILTLGQVIQGEVEQRLERRTAQESILHNFIREEGLEAFPAVVVAPYLSDGIESLVQCQGLGAVRSNTVMLGWPSDT